MGDALSVPFIVSWLKVILAIFCIILLLMFVCFYGAAEVVAIPPYVKYRFGSGNKQEVSYD